MDLSEIMKTSLNDFLKNSGLLLYNQEKDIYSLKKEKIQLIRNILGIKVPLMLIGGLGDIKLYSDVLDALETILNLIPSKYFIITSPEINKEFQTKLSQTQPQMLITVQEFDYREVLRGDYYKIYNSLEQVIRENIEKYEIICEITGGTKPVSITLIVLGKLYGLKRYYFSSRDLIEIP